MNACRLERMFIYQGVFLFFSTRDLSICGAAHRCHREIRNGASALCIHCVQRNVWRNNRWGAPVVASLRTPCLSDETVQRAARRLSVASSVLNELVPPKRRPLDLVSMDRG